MKCARALLAAITLVSGCATVQEPEAPVEPATQAPVPQVVAPPPVTKPSPPAKPVVVAPPVTPEPQRQSEVEVLVNEFARLRRLSPADLAREQEAARQSFNQSRSDGSRVKLAMAMAIPGTAGSDDARALDLLDPLVKTPAATLHALAVLMSAYINEQRRLSSQVTGLQQNVQGLQQNVQGLQQKLDAITKLERSLTGRGEGGAVRRR